MVWEGVFSTHESDIKSFKTSTTVDISPADAARLFLSLKICADSPAYRGTRLRPRLIRRSRHRAIAGRAPGWRKWIRRVGWRLPRARVGADTFCFGLGVFLKDRCDALVVAGRKRDGRQARGPWAKRIKPETVNHDESDRPTAPTTGVPASF